MMQNKKIWGIVLLVVFLFTSCGGPPADMASSVSGNLQESPGPLTDVASSVSEDLQEPSGSLADVSVSSLPDIKIGQTIEGYSYVLDMADLKHIASLCAVFFGSDLENMLENITQMGPDGPTASAYALLCTHINPYRKFGGESLVPVDYFRQFSICTFGVDVFTTEMLQRYAAEEWIDLSGFGFGWTGGYAIENDEFALTEESLMAVTFDLYYRPMEEPEEYSGNYTFYFESMEDGPTRYTKLVDIVKNSGA